MKYAAGAGQIAHRERAAVRFDAAATDRQSETEPRSLGAQLFERPHLDERPVDQVAQSAQAAIEEAARGPGQPYAAAFDGRDGEGWTKVHYLAPTTPPRFKVRAHYGGGGERTRVLTGDEPDRRQRTGPPVGSIGYTGSYREPSADIVEVSVVSVLESRGPI